MDRAADDQPGIPFPSSRFHDFDNFRFYYAYGNTPAEDYVQSVIDEKEPSVLVLGCGDMRSCFYTLWKNFSSYAVKTTGSHFRGAHFVLNDYSAAVLARNVLLLYIALNNPPRNAGMKKLISVMWAIWFCHELHPDHSHVLKEALRDLISLSENMQAWSHENNILRNIVVFGSLETLCNIRQFWSMWLHDDFGSVRKHNQARLEFLENSRGLLTYKYNYAVAAVMNYVHEGTNISTDGDKKVAMVSEITSYVEKGSVFAEMVLGMSMDTDATTVNPTFFEAQDHSYTLHYAAKPFDCFFHAVHFSKQIGFMKNMPSNVVMVEESCFDVECLLANSVQQFAVWVQAVQEVLKPVLDQPKPCFTFDLYCSDALQFCQLAQCRIPPPSCNCRSQVLESFDVIHSSNLIDHIALPAFIISALHLLKTKGLLFTTTFLYKSVAPTIEQYLEVICGFKPEMLPVLCGALCIGHEGQYADSTAVQPSPLSFESVLSGSNKEGRCSKLLVWQKTKGSPLVVPSLAKSSPITKALVGSIQSACKGLFGSEGVTVKSSLCTETAIQVFLAFVTQLERKVPISNYQFWEGVAILFNEDLDLMPFQMHVQAQALLHKIHLHLNLSPGSCPICKGQPLSSYFAKYSVVFDPKYSCTDAKNPIFPAFIHKDRDGSFVNGLCTDELQRLRKRDVHVIDSSSCSHVNGKIRMEFLFPHHFAQEEYYLTITYSTYLTVGGKTICFLQGISTVKLAEVEVKAIDYIGNGPCVSSYPTCSTFGQIVQHIGDGDKFQSVISFGEEVVELLKDPQISLHTQNISEYSLELLCVGNTLTLHYPYPVQYNSVKMQVSRKQGTVSVQSSRAMHSFWNRPPVFVASPDNHMCLLSIHLDPQLYVSVSEMQFSKHDRAICSAMHREPSLMPLDLIVKQTFAALLQESPTKKFIYFEIEETREKLGMILIKSKLYDTERKSPAIDLYYHFVNQNSQQLVCPGWVSMVIDVSDGAFGIIHVTKEEISRLQVIFRYFAAQTRVNVSSSPSLLHTYGISQYFSRATIYPLFYDQDRFVSDMGIDKRFDDISQIHQHVSPVESNDDNHKHTPSRTSSSTRTSASPSVEAQCCEFCSSQSSNLKKCSRCGKASYCNRDCQRNHWKEHQLICKPASEAGPKQAHALDRCTNCEKRDKPLKKCPCQLAAYCSIECQRNDRPRHSATCKSATGKK